MSAIFVKSAALAVAGSFLESKYGPPPNKDGPMGLSTWAGLTPLVFTYMSYWTLSYGFIVVGKARREAIEKAKKEGEQVELYEYPNLYAQGTSPIAKEFNCAQRSHQHILETFTQAAVTAMIATVHYPLAAAFNSVLYVVGRQAISNGYAKSGGDPAGRYSSPLFSLCWYGILSNMMLAGLSCVNMISGKKLLW